MRVWIDTDPALGYQEGGRPRDVDDAFCIIEAITHPDLELLGITPVFGNAPVDVGAEVSRELVRMTNARVDVIPGAASADDESGAADAARAMAAALREGPMHVLAIGPLTNVAALIRDYPDLTGQIREVVVVAGRSPDQLIELHGARGIPDFNFERDVEAFRILMESSVPVVFVGAELSGQVVLTREDLESLRGRSAVADHLVEGALPWLEWFTGAFAKAAGFHPWDSAALAYLTHPEFLVREERGWRLRERPEDTPATGSHWLELGVEFPGKRSIYCTGFTAGAKARFVRSILDGIP